MIVDDQNTHLYRSPSCFSSVAASRQAAPVLARGRSCNIREIAVRFNLIVGFSTVNRSSRGRN